MRRLPAAVLRPRPAHLVLGLIVVAGLVLRLRHNDYGLPYVYNVDEGSHFTNRAVGMLGGDPNPGYFQNPSGFTYLVHLMLRFKYGTLWPFGDFSDVVEQFRVDPSAIYDSARSLAAIVCMAGVIAVFVVGRRIWGTREGLVAAAVLAFAFLPVAYSRIAVTDVGTLLPVALAVYGAVRVHERGSRRDYLVAGAAVGLAIGFKYTAGLVGLPLLLAAGLRARDDRAALPNAGLALLAALAALFVTTPFLFLDFDTARRQIEEQAETAGELQKLGQEASGFSYYLDSLTWGLGWAAALAALAGAALELRRDRARGLILLLFPLALFLYLSLQSRFFGRWLLPAYPVLALLCGVALARLAGLVRGRPSAQVAALAAVTSAVLAQPLAADVRTARLLGRADTRQIARDFLVARFPSRLRIVIEPAVPGRYYRVARPGRRARPERKQFVRGFVRDIQETRIDYVATLGPGTIDRYRESGFCLVMTMGVIRARAERSRDPEARAYYARLEQESDLVYELSPHRAGEDPPEFHFDLSYNYYPTELERPGPEVKVYKLHDCEQSFGPVPRGTGTPEGGGPAGGS